MDPRRCRLHQLPLLCQRWLPDSHNIPPSSPLQTLFSWSQMQTAWFYHNTEKDGCFFLAYSNKNPDVRPCATWSTLHPWQSWRLYLLPGWSPCQGRCCWWWLGRHTWGCTALHSESGLQTAAGHLHTPLKDKQGNTIDLFDYGAINSVQAIGRLSFYSLPQTLLLQAALRFYTCERSPQHFPCVPLEEF